MNRIPPKELVALASQLTLHGANLSVVPDTDEYPWFIREFQKQLIAQEERRELLLPNIRDDNESIAIFSDYGGESPDSKYLTYSFLICAWNQTGLFTKAMEKLRTDSGLNSPLKEIAFKDFRYGPIRRALEGYLKNLSNYVNGYLLTVVVEKSAGSIFGTDRKATHEFITKTLSENGFGTWKPEVAEKILRITHFAAYLVALLSRAGGASQDSCRLIHAAHRVLFSAWRSRMTASRSGLSVTGPTGDQSRVFPDQRAGLSSRAWRYV